MDLQTISWQCRSSQQSQLSFRLFGVMVHSLLIQMLSGPTLYFQSHLYVRGCLIEDLLELKLVVASFEGTVCKPLV